MRNVILLENADVTIKTRTEDGSMLTVKARCSGVVDVEEDEDDWYAYDYLNLSNKMTYNLRLTELDESGTVFTMTMNGPVSRSASVEIKDITVAEINAARKRAGAPEDAHITFDPMRQNELISPQKGAPRPATVTFYWEDE
jgi:hypothetical protein